MINHKNTNILRDQTLYDELHQILEILPPMYDLLRLDPELLLIKRREFENSGYSEDPNLVPTSIDLDALAKQAEMLKELKLKVKNDDSLDPSIKQGYLWKINEEIANTRIVKAILDNDQRRIRIYNTFIYGEPSRDIFNSINQYWRMKAEESLTSSDETEVRLATEVLDILPEVPQSDVRLLPSEELFQIVKMHQVPFFESLLKGTEIPEDGFIRWDSADDYTRIVMDNAGIGSYTLADSSGSAWSVDNIREIVNRPKTAVKVSRERYIGLPVGHEIGTHAAEYINAIRRGLGLLALGFDRSEGPSEAKGTIREQIAFDSPKGLAEHIRFLSLMNRDYAISLAYGYGAEGDDGELKQRRFSDIYMIMQKIEELMVYKKTHDIGKSSKTAHNRTWSLLAERAMKATPGKGVHYYKDKIYLEYNLAMWKAIEANPELLDVWDIGKFDISNPRHVQILIDIGMLDAKSAT